MLNHLLILVLGSHLGIASACLLQWIAIVGVYLKKCFCRNQVTSDLEVYPVESVEVLRSVSDESTGDTSSVHQHGTKLSSNTFAKLTELNECSCISRQKVTEDGCKSQMTQVNNTGINDQPTTVMLKESIEGIHRYLEELKQTNELEIGEIRKAIVTLQEKKNSLKRNSKK